MPSHMLKSNTSMQTQKYSIPVSQAIINESVEKDSSHCMIATAIQTAIPDASRVSVDIQTIRFTKDRKRYIFLTPRKAQEAIIIFDSGQRPKPWTLALRNAQVIDLANRGPARLVTQGGGSAGSSRHVPAVRGGRAPPRIKARREFGLRSFDIIR